MNPRRAKWLATLLSLSGLTSLHAQTENTPLLYEEFKRIWETPAGIVDVTRMTRVSNLKERLVGNSLTLIERVPLSRGIRFNGYLRPDGLLTVGNEEAPYIIRSNLLCVANCWSFYTAEDGTLFAFEYFSDHTHGLGVIIEKGCGELSRNILWRDKMEQPQW